jgi:type IV secretory pathway VirB10-like protein
VVVIGAGVALVLILFAFNGLSRRSVGVTPGKSSTRQSSGLVGEGHSAPPDSLTPILDPGEPSAEESPGNAIDAEHLARIAGKKITPAPANLGAVPPFAAAPSWQAPPYADAGANLVGRNSTPEREDGKARHDNLDKPSLVFAAREASSSGLSLRPSLTSDPAREIQLQPGTRLRARLEAAVSSAVHAPVVAVVEYDYEQNGDVVIPAGAKVMGRLEGADRSGYVEVRFDTLSISDMPLLRLEGVATDLQLRPLRGRVEGSNRSKNLLVRSVAGVGQIAATLGGRGSLDQPLSESDLLRERLSNNIGQAADQQVAGLALSQQPVVTLSAGTEIYVVLEKFVDETTLPDKARRGTANQPSVEELRQLLQLQRELNDSASGPPQ